MRTQMLGIGLVWEKQKEEAPAGPPLSEQENIGCGVKREQKF